MRLPPHLPCSYAAGRAADLLGRSLDRLHLVVADLDGGDAISAVREGRRLDTWTGASGPGRARRARRQIAAVATALDRVDALVFTGVHGWDEPELRHDICAGLRVLRIGTPYCGNLRADGPVTPWDARTHILLVRPRENAAESVSPEGRPGSRTANVGS
jgi:acetate kinase